MDRMILRAHHIYCLRFMTVGYLAGSTRGTSYEQQYEKIVDFLKTGQSNSKTEVEISIETDSLCRACSNFDGKECVHPNGGEADVQKWDKKLLAELGLSAGQVIRLEQIQKLIKEKAPLDFCLLKCQHYQKQKCNPFETQW